jgi:hypothetical protein
MTTLQGKGACITPEHPHVVPVCFAHDGHVFCSALDLKPKRVPPEQLARVRHIQAQPNVVVLRRG